MLCSNGIPCCVVKGAAVAEHYPVPSSRVLGDIDLLVPPEDFDRACQLVSGEWEYFGENYRHKEYKKNGIALEIHRGFSTIHEMENRELFDRRIFDAIERCEGVKVGDYEVSRLPATEHGLTLIEHIDIHLENGLGLRQIVDWMMFVDRELDDQLWHRDFAPFLRQINREKLAITVTKMCQMYLGLEKDITWCDGADEDLCQRLMEYVLNQGNFGRKMPRGSNRAAVIIGTTGNPVSFFRIIQKAGCVNWKAIERFPFLRYFAWLYQIFHYIHLGLSTKHPIRMLKGAVKRSKSKTDFLGELGVSRTLDEGKRG